MCRIPKKLKSEKGSAAIEFLGMVPLVLLLMVALWQFFAGAYAFIVTQSAANEAAKVYAMTENIDEATSAANKVVSAAGDSILFNASRTSINASSERQFSASVGVDFELSFLKKLFKGSTPKIPLDAEVSSRVIK
ncbi:TadE/TadG family type IV pilus assembly protein [Fictibacillus sp. 18YEL24]|uniref:TadE/TadG family type IV pilus assembly protein n=1 Tax=Fictibacillus sp. 18YEL24 TaxID=2745875 RepID=UPI0018CD32B8|nr:TadE family protein [Fictibacillus sp. 18YEL24]MBH0171677.1 pilus assembly protein [Fictibacillus sp. 18YEL24]